MRIAIPQRFAPVARAHGLRRFSPTMLGLFGHTVQCKGLHFSSMQKVAMIGLGAMGSGMAGQLLKAGFPLAVYNRKAERAMEAGKGGARLAQSPREAAEDADIIVAML